MEMKVNSSRPLRTMACLPVRIQSWEKGFWGSLAERLRFPNAGTARTNKAFQSQATV